MKRSQIYAAAMSYNLRRTVHEFGLGVEIDRFCTAVEMEKENAAASSIGFCNSLLDPSLIPEKDDPKLAETNYFLESSDELDAAPGEKLKIPAVMHAPFNELAPAAIDPEILSIAYKRYDQAYRIAKQLGIRKMVVHSGWIPRIYFKSWQLERSIEFWSRFMEDRDDIEIVIENVMEDEPQMLADLIRDLDHPRIQACLDTGHALCASDVPLEKWIDTLAPYLGHFHVHENHGKMDEHMALGTCGIGLSQLFGAINEICCSGATLTIESHDSFTSAKWLDDHGFIE